MPLTSYLQTGKVSALKSARRRFMKDHGRVFFALRIMQYFWYGSDRRREQFVQMCRDPDVQRLTWEAYLNKTPRPPGEGSPTCGSSQRI